jgi:hypothetical protein
MPDDLALTRIASAIARLSIEMERAGMKPPVAIVVTGETRMQMYRLGERGVMIYDCKTRSDKLANIPIIEGDIDGLRRGN